jgi:hypothetical protein
MRGGVDGVDRDIAIRMKIIMNSSQLKAFIKLRTVAAPLLLSVLAISSHGNPQQRLITVQKIDENHLTYFQYELKETQQVDLSDLILTKELTTEDASIPYQLEVSWSEVPNFKVLLLKAGLARLRNPESADEIYRAAEAQAKAGGIGVWATPTPAPTPRPSVLQHLSTPSPQLIPQGPSPYDQFKKFVMNGLSFLWQWLVTLSPFGIGAILLTALYYFLWVRRRVRLLIIGKMSAGKTAVYLRLMDPTIDEQRILDLEQSQAKQKIRLRQHIRYAKFEIYPRLTDVPGAAYSTVWDELTKFRFMRRHAMILVLSPTIVKVRSSSEELEDDKYLSTQLGYVEAFVEGALGARKTRKPKVMVLFLNKFDLFSQFPPGDSHAVNEQKHFLSMFSEHLKSVDVATKKANIKLHIIVGSALKNWNCDNLINSIGKSLYGS